VLDVSYKVYGIKTIVAIPLLEERAKATIKMVSTRNIALGRPSLLPRSIGVDPAPDEVEQEARAVVVETPTLPSPHVQFSSNNQVKLVTPVQESFERDPFPRSESPHSTSSGVSTPSSEQTPTSPILKAVTTRLSFWNRTSKRDSSKSRVSQRLPMESQATQREQETLDKIIQDAEENPAEVIKTILATAAPPPTTTEERHSELEDKVIRECIREFTKSDMYFSYTFGTLPAYRAAITQC
jgi:hypothetical protein